MEKELTSAQRIKLRALKQKVRKVSNQISLEFSGLIILMVFIVYVLNETVKLGDGFFMVCVGISVFVASVDMQINLAKANKIIQEEHKKIMEEE